MAYWIPKNLEGILPNGENEYRTTIRMPDALYKRLKAEVGGQEETNHGINSMMCILMDEALTERARPTPSP